MKLVGTTVVCVLIAFGAAFGVARSTDQHSATTPASPAKTPPKVEIPPLPQQSDAKLAAQFAPQLTTLKLIVPRRHKHHTATPAVTPAYDSAAVTSPSTSSSSSSEPATSTPSTAPSSAVSSSAPSSSSSSSSSPPSSGTGVTSVGGSSHRSGGSGKTTIGG